MTPPSAAPDRDSSAPRTGTRPVLRPGVHVLRRSAEEVQVGLDPRRAVVLPDRPEVHALLATLTTPGEPLDPDRLPDDHQRSTLEALTAGGLLVDADLLLPLLPHAATPARATRAAVAAVALDQGDRTEDVLARRAACTVSVTGFGADHALAPRLAELLALSGLTVLPAGRECGVSVLVGVGEPEREVIDPWMRSGRPHLLLRLVEGCATIGPFVVPGGTACLRCIDAHHADLDPAWPLLVTQYARASARDRPVGVPEPVDPLLAGVATAWAAREVVTHAEGRTPGCVSTTLRFHPDLSALETHTWLRHPHCGCCWA